MAKDSTALHFDDALESSIERNNFGGDGMLERCGYRAALILSALIAVVNWSVFIYVQRYLPRLGDGSAIYAVGAVLVLGAFGCKAGLRVMQEQHFIFFRRESPPLRCGVART